MTQRRAILFAALAVAGALSPAAARAVWSESFAFTVKAAVR